MVDDLGVRVVIAHVRAGRLAGIVIGVPRARDGLDGIALDEDDDVLPVVAMAGGVGYVFHGYVFLEVISVDVGAPAVVAARAHVDVVVVQVGGVAATVGSARVVVVKPFSDIAVGINRWGIIASVSVTGVT